MIYNFLLYVFYFIIKVISIWSSKGRFWINGRKNWKTKLTKQCSINKSWIWFHCASLGEFEDGRAVIEQTKKEFPKYSILLTFSSPSGYEVKKNYSLADYVCYLPIDTSSNAKTFVEILKPTMVVFVRNDIWMNYLKALKKKGIPTFLLSFNMNKKSSFIKWPQASFYRKAFLIFDKIFVQNNRTEELLKVNIGVDKTVMIGNTRINSIFDTYQQKHLFPEIEKFVDNDFCIISGSALKKDQAIFIETYFQMHDKKIKWIIAPHEINASEINAQLAMSKKMIKYSEINKLTSEHDFLWIDNVGMLAKLYRYSDLAFIGGGFNKIGIHSILEPAVYGCPTAFGPNHRNYIEALDLIERKGAKIINNENELKQFVSNYYANAELLKNVKNENQEYVRDRKGQFEPVFEIFSAVLKK